MKKLPLVILLIFGVSAFGVDNKKTTALDALTAIDNADIAFVVDDVSGTPVTKKITILDFFDTINTEAKFEAICAALNFLIESEIDASAELIALMDDETGTGALTFATSPALVTPGVTGGVTFADADISPNAAGELVYDNTVAGLLDGAFAWYDDDAVRYFVDLATLPTDDDYVVAYDAAADGFYMKADADTGGNTSYHNIVDPTASGSISFDAAEAGVYTSSVDEWVGITISNTAAAHAGDSELLTLAFTVDGDTNSHYLIMSDAAGTQQLEFIQSTADVIITSAGDLKFVAGGGDFDFANDNITTTGTVQGGSVSDGTATLNAGSWTSIVGVDGSGTISANLFTPDAADGADIGSATLEFSDIYLADGSIIKGQNDQSNTITSSATDWTFALDITVSGGNINTGNIPLIVGDATTDTIQLLTDGTGDAEIALPTGSISGTEILDDTVDSADYAAGSIDEEHLNVTNAPGAGEDNYVLTYNHASTNFTWAVDATGGTTAYDDIGDPDAASIIDFDDDESVTWTTMEDSAGSFFMIDNSDADLAANTYLLHLIYSDDDDQANADYFKCEDQGGVVLTIQQDGDFDTAGTLEAATITEGGQAVWNASETDILDSGHYIAASIDNEHLANNAVDSEELAAGSIDQAHFAVDVIGVDEMENVDHGDVQWSGGDADVESMDLGDASTGTYYLGLFADDTGTSRPIYADAPLSYAQATGTLAATEFSGGGASLTGVVTAWDDIGNPDNSGLTTVTFDNAEATLLTGNNDAAVSFFTIQNSDGDHTVGNMFLLDLDYSADNDDTDADYIKCQDSGGVVFQVKAGGDTQIEGSLAVVETVYIGSAAVTPGNMTMYDAGTLTIYEDGDNFNVTLACNSGEAVATLTGGLDITGVLTTSSNIVSEPKHLRFNIFDPLAVQTLDTQVCIVPLTSAALTITNIKITLDAAGNEVVGDLKYADTFIGLASPNVINICDTSSGVLNDSAMGIAAVPATKCIYFQFDSAPHTDITQMSWDITYDYD